MMGRPRVLLTTPPGPYPVHPPDRDGIDQFGLRFTKRQGLFEIPIDYPFHLGVHLIARNLDAEVTVLDAPAPSALARELARRPDVVGITLPHVLIPQALEAARLVRRFAPGARLVLGGHGVSCLARGDPPRARARLPLVETVPGSPARAAVEELGAIADEVCQGEGVAFVRRLLGQDPDAALDGTLPPSGVLRPFNLPLVPARNMVSVAPALGCSGGCEFCTTGTFFGGQRRVILDPEQAARSIHAQLERVPCGQRALGVVMDEDVLRDRDWFTAFGRALAADPLVRARRFTWTGFGSVRALEQYDVEDLLRYRLSNLWVGVETTLPETGLSYLDRKRRGREAGTFERLHAAGITTTASFIIGWDFHDARTLAADVEALLALRPSMVQVLPLIPAPGTALWARMAAEGRVDPIARWEDVHYYGRGFRYRHFTVDELWRVEDEIERRLHEEQGPSYLKMALANLAGLERWRDHADPALADFAEVLASFLDDLRPVLPLVARHARATAVAAEARRTLARIEALLGPPSLAARARAVALRGLGEAARLGLGLPRPYQPRPQRTVYLAGRAVESAWGGP